MPLLQLQRVTLNLSFPCQEKSFIGLEAFKTDDVKTDRFLTLGNFLCLKGNHWNSLSFSCTSKLAA